MSQQPLIYSPKPIASYRLEGTVRDEVSAIQQIPDPVAVWNFFWLCNPRLDVIPEAGRMWHRHYHPTENLLASVVRDVGRNEPLNRKLLMHPVSFADWFERQDHKSFYVHGVVGVMWADIVMKRARQASDRLLTEYPAVRIVGNVIHHPFGKTA